MTSTDQRTTSLSDMTTDVRPENGELAMTDVITSTTDALVLDALRAAKGPIGAAAVLVAVRGMSGVRLPRPTVYGSLARLTAGSRAYRLDHPGQPRTWAAIPRDFVTEQE